MDLYLRADPGAMDGVVSLRPCCVEINSHKKLRRLLSDLSVLNPEEDIDASTFDRIIRSELERRQCRLTFAKNDHNACPHCKASEHEILRLIFEVRLIERDKGPQATKRAKEARLEELVAEYEAYNLRDAQIRKFINRLTDFFKKRENQSRIQESLEGNSRKGTGWMERGNHGLLWHQDDSTKVNVPHFTVQSQSDLTAFRHDLNAHVSAVTGRGVVFTHDQGMNMKNGSSIVETIILNLLLNCRGEDVVIVVSDCAAAGRNYVTTVAITSYLVNNGFARVAIMAFLENCHGKYLAERLFGQFQRSARNTDFVSVDGLMEVINSLQSVEQSSGYIVNPLACIDWRRNFEKLGYAVTPPSDLRWNERDIHFACAASPDAKEILCEDLLELLHPLMPSHPGMVRLSYSPPGESASHDVRFEKRPIDVPAISEDLLLSPSSETAADNGYGQEETDVRVVVEDTPFQKSGDCVMSQKTATDLGYNAMNWNNRSPELRNNAALRQKLWPPNYQPFDIRSCGSIKIAPENWILRAPVKNLARYPPKNFINALCGAPPRESLNRIPVETYYEAPFPLIEDTSAWSGIKRFEEECKGKLSESVSVLHLLNSVYRVMEDTSNRERGSTCYLQAKAIKPPSEAIEIFNANMLRSVQRERGRPKAAKSAYQFFKLDPDVIRIVDEKVSGMEPGRGRNEARTRTFKELWVDYRGNPLKGSKFIELSEEDDRRYELETAQFRELQCERDRRTDAQESIPLAGQVHNNGNYDSYMNEPVFSPDEMPDCFTSRLGGSDDGSVMDLISWLNT